MKYTARRHVYHVPYIVVIWGSQSHSFIEKEDTYTFLERQSLIKLKEADYQSNRNVNTRIFAS